MDGPFGFDANFTGAWVVVEREPICSSCRSNAEVDREIDRLKANLDSVALLMKAEVLRLDGKALTLDVNPDA